MSVRRLALFALALQGALISPVLAAGETGAPGPVPEMPTPPSVSQEKDAAALEPLPDLPPAPPLKGPTLAAMQLALPLVGGWMMSRGLPEDLDPRVQTYTRSDGTTGSYTTGDYRPRASLAAAGTSLLLMPGYLALGQVSAGTDALLTAWLMAGFGALVGYQAGGQPPFSGNLTGQALDDKRIGTALIGTGLGFLTGQVRSALDVWARADDMQAEHDRVKALRSELKARRQAMPDDPAPVVDPVKPLGELSLVKPPSVGEIALWSLINMAGHVVLPTAGFTATYLTNSLPPLAFALGVASLASIPAASGLTHFTRGDWSGGLDRSLKAVPVTALGAAAGAAGGVALARTIWRSDPYETLFGALAGLTVGSLISLAWWDVDSARDALVRDRDRKREANEQPTEAPANAE